MLGLNGYGSDESDTETAPAQVAPAKEDTVTKQAPTGKKRERGPVKIMLDLPAPSASNQSLQAEPLKKKPKLDFGARSGSKSGLAAMLPAPKKLGNVASANVPAAAPALALPSTAQPPVDHSSNDPATEDAQEDDSLQGPAFIPHTVKKKADLPAASAGSNPFFGSPAVSQNTKEMNSVSGSSSSKISISSAPSVKDAPKVNYYATLPPATPDNPYPGFHCLSSGQWVADKPDDWQEWAEQHGWASSQTATDDGAIGSAQEGLNAQRGFENADLGDMQEYDPSQDKPGAPKIPPRESKIVPLDAEAEEKKRQQLARFQGRGRGKNQLSNLLTDAVRRREELEERIAVAKQNKRAGGAKCESAFKEEALKL